jgi:hypothetical protein
MSSFTSTLNTYDTTTKARFVSIEEDLAAIRLRQGIADRVPCETRAQRDLIIQQLALPEAAVPLLSGVRTQAFDRDIDTTSLKLNTTTMVSKERLLTDVVFPLLDKADVKHDAIKFLADAIDNKFFHVRPGRNKLWLREGCSKRPNACELPQVGWNDWKRSHPTTKWPPSSRTATRTSSKSKNKLLSTSSFGLASPNSPDQDLTPTS